MATRSATRATTKGVCSFCKGEFDKGKMTQHMPFASKVARHKKLATEMINTPTESLEERMNILSSSDSVGVLTKFDDEMS